MGRTDNWSRWLLVAIFGVGLNGTYARAADVAASADPREALRETGYRLLMDRKWAQAAEHFGAGFAEDLVLCVDRAWSSAVERDPEQLARFRHRLAHFLFDHVDFDFPFSAHNRPSRVMERFSKAYPGLRDSILKEDHVPPLDFTHVETMAPIIDRAVQRQLTPADRTAILEALRTHPESLPALAAFISYSGSVAGQEEQQIALWRQVSPFMTGPRGKLTLARNVKHSVPYVKGLDFPLMRAILVEARDLPPSDEQKGDLLYALARLQARMAKANQGEETPEKALATAAEVYEKLPRTRSAAEARVLAVAIHLYGGELESVEDFSRQPAGGADKALALVRSFQKQAPSRRVGLDRALMEIAHFHLVRKEHDRSEPLMLEVVRDHSGSEVASRAMLCLAKLCEEKGEDARQGAWLRRCVESEVQSPSGRGILGGGVSSEAIVQLAQWLERHTEWKEALHWWTTWKPSSSCGTCLAGMRAQRWQGIARCQLHLGATTEAARTCAQAVFAHGDWGSAGLAELLFRIYREAGQLDDLGKMVAAFEEERLREFDAQGYFKDATREQKLRFLATRTIRELESDHGLSAAKNVAQLVAICQQSNSTHVDTFKELSQDHRCRAAAEALAALGDTAVKPVREAIENRAGSISWLIYSLGRNASPAALDALKELQKTERSWNMDNVAYALYLKGDEGRKLLAAATLERIRKEARNVPAWPALKPGSLPKTLAELR